MRRFLLWSALLPLFLAVCSNHGHAQMSVTANLGPPSGKPDSLVALLPDAPLQAGTAPTPTQTQTQTAPAAPSESQREQAERELREEEHQRMLGVVPNFNTVNQQNAAPLTSGQKFRLAFRSALDPFEFVVAGADAGISQAEDEYEEYGEGAVGYFKRFGASYADSADGVLWGNAILPVLFHEDPRYFRKGTGSIMSRVLYSVSTTVRTKEDNGTWGWNYANVLGNITAGGISNLYYPASDRGVGLTFERAFTVTAEGSLGALAVEFYPDIVRGLFHRKGRQPAQPSPK